MKKLSKVTLAFLAIICALTMCMAGATMAVFADGGEEGTDPAPGTEETLPGDGEDETPDEPATKYNIETVCEHATVTFTELESDEEDGAYKAAAGETVSFTVTADSGYKVNTVKVGEDTLTAEEGVY
ncbi:MAG: hypothetical protein K2N18_04120, partial [Clostridia bacterium]|nr:hypothetical protein [Clostridia bacterium]